MEIILRADVQHLGKIGEVVKVKDGYARNYLLPQGLAYPATEANKKKITYEGERLAKQQAAEKSATFEGIVLTVGQGNQMIGVNIGDIAVDAAFIEALLVKVLEKFTPDTLVTMTFRKAHFARYRVRGPADHRQ